MQLVNTAVSVVKVSWN